MSTLVLALVTGLVLSCAAQDIHVNAGGGNLGPNIVSDKPAFHSKSSGPVRSFGSGTTTYASHAYVDGGTLVYSLPAKAGSNVKVTMQFMETWTGAFRAGVRRMRVSINNVVVESNLDVFARAGARKPLDISRTIVVPSNGLVEVKLQRVAQNVMISGIRLQHLTGGSAPVQTGRNLFNVNIGSGGDAQYRSQPVGSFRIGGSGKHLSHVYAFNKAALVHTFPVQTGTTVKVTAEFGEIFTGAQRNGARRMRVLINGVVVEPNLDVFARVGANKPFFTSRTFRVTNGQVVVRVEPLVENAMISGVLINAVGNAPPQPSPPPSNSGTSKWPPTNLKFKKLNINGGPLPQVRHEGGSVFCNSKVYVIGGRGLRGMWAYDPKTSRWTQRKNPGVELHHFQAACIGSKVYIVGAWFGQFPNERAHQKIYVYNTETDSWNTDLPNPAGVRLRGGGAVGVFGTKLILATGSSGGHGAPTILKPQTDVMDTAAANPVWVPWADFPDPRDHTGGAVVNDLFCVAGGRDGSAPGFSFWRANSPSIYCINIKQGPPGKWMRMANLPNPRGGVAVGATCDGYLMVAGGEAETSNFRGAYNRVDIFDPVTNKVLNPPVRLARGRHGTGLATTPCSCGKIYISCGSGNIGGGPELNDIEVWSRNGDTRPC